MRVLLDDKSFHFTGKGNPTADALRRNTNGKDRLEQAHPLGFSPNPKCNLLLNILPSGRVVMNLKMLVNNEATSIVEDIFEADA
jgi:hypothetical protein